MTVSSDVLTEMRRRRLGLKPATRPEMGRGESIGCAADAAPTLCSNPRGRATAWTYSTAQTGQPLEPAAKPAKARDPLAKSPRTGIHKTASMDSESGGDACLPAFIS